MSSPYTITDFNNVRGTVVRLMSPLGLYWSDSSLFENAAYVVREDLIFTACHYDRTAYEGDFYSEYDNLKPEEVRLSASLALPMAYHAGMVVQYPSSVALYLADRPRLDDINVIATIEGMLRSALSKVAPSQLCQSIRADVGYHHALLHLPVPVHRRLFIGIDPLDHLLIRGLGTWIKSAMLNSHSLFSEEAHYPLWISLDASFSIIQGTLRTRGIPMPTAVDAGDFMSDAFGEPRNGKGYFAEYYEDRIKATHPQSRFGTFPFAPVSHSDFYMLYKSLRDVYRVIVLGEVVDPHGPSALDSA